MPEDEIIDLDEPVDFSKDRDVVGLALPDDEDSETEMSDKDKIPVATRLWSMFLDHFFMSFIASIFYIPYLVSVFMKILNGTINQVPLNKMFWEGNYIYIGTIGYAIYFCKDCINGRSIAKRIVKLQVVDNTTGQVASPIKCLIRNL